MPLEARFTKYERQFRWPKCISQVYQMKWGLVNFVDVFWKFDIALKWSLGHENKFFMIWVISFIYSCFRACRSFWNIKRSWEKTHKKLGPPPSLAEWFISRLLGVRHSYQLRYFTSNLTETRSHTCIECLYKYMKMATR